ncbi:MAG: hypothetical protein ACQES3_00475 [Pseudomonadota bacterium]
MKLRSKRGVNCDEARERTTSVMENTTPAIVVIEAAMILSARWPRQGHRQTPVPGNPTLAHREMICLNHRRREHRGPKDHERRDEPETGA